MFITLFRGWTASGAYVWSPFAIKLETRLRLGNVSYTSAGGSPRTAPRGKIPYMVLDHGSAETSSQKETLSDTAVIIATLTERGLLPVLNAKLAPTERAQDLALRALFEEKLYFYHMYERWIRNFYTMRNYVFGSMPRIMRYFIGILARRKAVATLHAQGTGRLAYSEISTLRREVWESVAGVLAESRRNKWEGGCFWVLGKEGPTEADPVVFAFITSVLISDAAPDSRKVLAEFPVLEEYASAIHDTYFPDYQKWPTSECGGE